MKLLTSFQCEQPVVLVLGLFDGVHRGHVALVRRAKEIAQGRKGYVLIHTFDRNPMEVIMPTLAPKRLQPLSSRVRDLSALGPDGLWVQPFDSAYARVLPEVFIDTLVKRFHPTDIVTGYNHSFGRDGLGTPALLAWKGNALQYRSHIVAALTWRGAPISSSRIRQALTVGKIQDAAAMLGRFPAIYGRIEHNGRFRTDPHGVQIAPGVYSVYVREQNARLVLGEESRLWGVDATRGWTRVTLLANEEGA